MSDYMKIFLLYFIVFCRYANTTPHQNDEKDTKFFHIKEIFKNTDNCKLHTFNTYTLLEVLWLQGEIDPPCTIIVKPSDVPYTPFCVEIEVADIKCPGEEIAWYTTKLKDNNLYNGVIRCAEDMSHEQCFPSKTILRATFASMEKKNDSSRLSIKFYTTNDENKMLIQGGCWKDWKAFGNHCYLFSSDTKNWADAKKSCEGMHGTLVKIESEFENAWLHENRGTVDMWTSGIRKWNDEFVWYDTTTESMPYTNWFQREPNDFGGNEDCMQLWYKGFWNDINCSHTFGYICERNI